MKKETKNSWWFKNSFPYYKKYRCLLQKNFESEENYKENRIVCNSHHSGRFL